MTSRPHPAWGVAAVAFLALLGAAGFRSAPSALMVPMEQSQGWSRAALSAAVSVNIMLFGLTAPFAAALMERFGIKRVCATALGLIAAGAAFSVLCTQSWQLLFTWGVLIGLGSGAMALIFAATVVDRWFVARRGLVTGVLTAASSTGQLIFLPIVASLSGQGNWRVASLVIAGIALAVIPLVLLFLHEHPAALGLTPYGAAADVEPASPPPPQENPARRALGVLGRAAHRGVFWALAGGFAICGATTNGLVATHFIPAAVDHGMAETAAAGLLALVGIFDIAGTILSGLLTDRLDPRWLLALYYLLRGVSLAALPALLSATLHPSMVAFIVFYGLDWVATVPPTVQLCRRLFGDDGAVVFGWVFASHQIGASIAATVAALLRDSLGSYTWAWIGGAGLCVIAVALSLLMPARRAARPAPEPSA